MSSFLLVLACFAPSALGATQVLDVGPARATRAAGLRANTQAQQRGLGGVGGQLLAPLRAEVVDQLPPGWRLGGLRLVEAVPREALFAGRGPVRVEVAMPQELSAGPNQAQVTLWRGDAPVGRTLAELTLWPAHAARPAAVVGRGQEVLVVVRNGNVTVQTKGVTQQAASFGERIGVLPNGSTHTVQGVVRDAKTVEVPL